MVIVEASDYRQDVNLPCVGRLFSALGHGGSLNGLGFSKTGLKVQLLVTVTESACMRNVSMGDMDGTWELRGRARGLVVRTPGTAACAAGSLGLVDEVLDAEGGAHGVRDRLSVALARPVLHEREDGGRTRKHHAERDGCGGVADHGADGGRAFLAGERHDEGELPVDDAVEHLLLDGVAHLGQRLRHVLAEDRLHGGQREVGAEVLLGAVQRLEAHVDCGHGDVYHEADRADRHACERGAHTGLATEAEQP
eukprot:scaffold46818_cov73-Phaeocystis_antarctica.AAC.1